MDNSRFVETEIYRTVVPEMLKCTPHLAKYHDSLLVDTKSLRRWLSSATTTEPDALAGQLGHMELDHPDRMYHVLVTESVIGTSFETWLYDTVKAARFEEYIHDLLSPK